MIVAGINYIEPTATLLHVTPLVNAEIAGRTCYSSFKSSEHEQVREFDGNITEDIESSALLYQLCHTYFHESVIEHINLTFSISTSRGVLQELARHRIASYSVQSTRYTMQDVLHAFNACSISQMSQAKYNFQQLLLPMKLFVVTDKVELIEVGQLYDKLHHQLLTVGNDEFGKLTMGKDALEIFKDRNTYEEPIELFNKLVTCKNKRNVGDAFKWIVTDNWKVNLVMTMNLRSLKNFYKLRDSGAAYFQIALLAKAMKAITPNKYLNLITKGNSNE